jgi:hypothetical protein
MARTAAFASNACLTPMKSLWMWMKETQLTPVMKPQLQVIARLAKLLETSTRPQEQMHFVPTLVASG